MMATAASALCYSSGAAALASARLRRRHDKVPSSSSRGLALGCRGAGGGIKLRRRLDVSATASSSDEFPSFDDAAPSTQSDDVAPAAADDDAAAAEAAELLKRAMSLRAREIKSNLARMNVPSGQLFEKEELARALAEAWRVRIATRAVTVPLRQIVGMPGNPRVGGGLTADVYPCSFNSMQLRNST